MGESWTDNEYYTELAAVLLELDRLAKEEEQQRKEGIKSADLLARAEELVLYLDELAEMLPEDKEELKEQIQLFCSSCFVPYGGLMPS